MKAPEILSKQIICLARNEIELPKGDCSDRVREYWTVAGSPTQWNPPKCDPWCVAFVLFILRIAFEKLKATNTQWEKYKASVTWGNATDTARIFKKLGIPMYRATDGFVPSPGMIYWRNRLPLTANEKPGKEFDADNEKRSGHLGITDVFDGNINTIDGNAGYGNQADTTRASKYTKQEASDLRMVYFDVASFFDIDPSLFVDCDVPPPPAEEFGPPPPPPGDSIVPPTPPNGENNNPPTPCVSTEWRPSVDYCEGTKFKQVDNCGNVREVVGKKPCNTQVFCPPGTVYNSNTGECKEPCNDEVWNPPIPSNLCNNSSFLQTSNCGNTRVVKGVKECNTPNEFGKCSCTMPTINIRVKNSCTPAPSMTNSNIQRNEFDRVARLSDGNNLLEDIQNLAQKYGIQRARTIGEYISNIQNLDISKLPNKEQFLTDIQDLATKYKNSTELSDKAIGMSLQLIVDRYAKAGTDGSKNFVKHCVQQFEIKVTNRTKHFSMLSSLNEQGKPAIAGAIMRVGDKAWGMRPDERPNSEPIKVNSREEALALGRNEQGYALSKDENLAQNDALFWIAGANEAPKGNGKYLTPETSSASRALATGVFCDKNGNAFFCVSDFDDRHKLYMKNRVYGERVCFFTSEDFKQGNWERRRQEAALIYVHPQKAGGRYKQPMNKDVGPWEKIRLRTNDFFEPYHYGYSFNKVFNADERAFIDSIVNSIHSGNFYLVMEHIESKGKKWDFNFVFLMEVNNAGLSWNMVLKIVANYVLPLVSTALNVIFPGMGAVLQQAISIGMKVVADALNKIADGIAITLDFAVAGIFEIVKATLPKDMQSYADSGLNAYNAVRSGDYAKLASSLGAMVPPEFRQQFNKALNEGVIGDVMKYVKTNVDNIKQTVTSFVNITLPNSMSSMLSDVGIQKFNNDIISGASTLFTAKDPAGRAGMTNLFTSLAQGGIPNILAPQLSNLQSVVQGQLKLNVAQIDAFTRLSAGLDEIPSDVFESFAVEGIKQVAKTAGQSFVVMPEGFDKEREECIGKQLAEELAEDGIMVVLRGAEIPTSSSAPRSAGGTNFGTNSGTNGGGNSSSGNSSQGQTTNCPPPVINLNVESWKWTPCLDDVDIHNEFDKITYRSVSVRPDPNDPLFNANYTPQTPLLPQNQPQQLRDRRKENVELWLKGVGGFSSQNIADYLSKRKAIKLFEIPIDQPTNDPSFNPILGDGNVGLLLYSAGSDYDIARASFVPAMQRILGEWDYMITYGMKTEAEIPDMVQIISNLANNVRGRFNLAGLHLNDGETCDAHCRDIRKLYFAIKSLNKAPNGAYQKDYTREFEMIMRELEQLKNKQTTCDTSQIRSELQNFYKFQTQQYNEVLSRIANLKMICPQNQDYAQNFKRIEELLAKINTPTGQDYSKEFEALRNELSLLRNKPDNHFKAEFDKAYELLRESTPSKETIIERIKEVPSSNDALLERLKLLELKLDSRQIPNENKTEILKELITVRENIIHKIETNEIDSTASYELPTVVEIQEKANRYSRTSRSTNSSYSSEWGRPKLVIYEYPDKCCPTPIEGNDCCEFG
ncbi:MAG: hypothetical protein JNL36_07620 [Candidatus Kapabacteria bacterium]|nr:hypothetical protein [Candidatus Kapabacteria bacterium]